MPIAGSYDILVVGAGPAGSSAARAAAQKGATVLMVDRRQRIGVPVQCAEFVPRAISRYVSFSTKCIAQTVETMITHLPDQRSYEMKSPGFMLDRSLFDKELAASAVLSGAKISMGTRAVEFSQEGVGIERGGKHEWVRARVIIGADGVRSSVAQWAGLPPGRTTIALQYEVVLPHPQNHVDIYFHKDYEGGYAWFFPKGKTANVGIGVVSHRTSSLPNLMEGFLNRLIDLKKMGRIEIIGKTGGAIPCEKPRQTVFDNIMLAGDAAGHAHPITGAGILNAVIGGEMAGRIAAESLARGDLNHLWQYETEWREAFGASLSYGAFKRDFLEENWNKPEIDFESLIRKTWVGFKEYYKDRRKIPLHPPFSKGEKEYPFA